MTADIRVNGVQALKVASGTLATASYEKMYEIAKAVHLDQSLKARFAIDPAGVANSINGFVAPAGYHMHVVDENNVYYPDEDAATQIKKAQGNWARIEVRAGYEKIACIICLWCGASAIA